MPATFSIPTQNVIPGQLITAVLWNGEFNNLFVNFTPAGMDDYAVTDGQFQTQTDPFPAGAISRPTSLAGELERIRFEIAQMKGKTYHYIPSDVTLDALTGQVSPFNNAGLILPYGGSSTPAGWLPCNGAAVNRTTFAALFAVIGTTFGVGDGSTTFNVPDLRGRAPIGMGTGVGLTNRPIGIQIGEENHLLTTAEMPAHSHSISNVNMTLNADLSDHGLGGVIGRATFNNNVGADTNFAFTFTINNTGGGGTHNNMQPSLAVNFLIKT